MQVLGYGMKTQLIACNMKRLLLIALILMCTGLYSNAQESKADKKGEMHLELDYTVAGEGKCNLNKTDFALNDFSIKLGYRFKNRVALYVPVTLSIAKQNLTSTRNYTDQTLLGIGTEYGINLKNTPIFLDLSLASTITQAEQQYFTGAFMIKVGGRINDATPTVGIGIIYNKPYNNIMKDRLLLGFSLGCRLF